MSFFRTPKGLLLVVLAGLLCVAVPYEGARLVLPGLAAALAAAAAVDALILRWRNGGWELPSGALLTALIVAMVLSPHERWWVVVVTAVFGVVTKYLFRVGSANVFNPAALALVASFYAFGTAQSWWGGLPDLPIVFLAVLLAAGLFIADRVNKIPMAIAFLGVYYLLFTAAAFLSAPEHVAEVFRAPDLQAALYFAFFILTDPPTSPTRYRDQIICAAVVAATAYLVFEGIGAVHYLLAGVLAGNLWEAARRIRQRHASRLVSPRSADVQVRL